MKTSHFEALIELRTRKLVAHGAARSSVLERSVRDFLVDGLERVERAGDEVEVLESNGVLVGFAALWVRAHSWYVGPCQVGCIELADGSDPAQLAFALAAFAGWRERLRADFDMFLDDSVRPLVRALVAEGELAIDSVQLLGQPQRALDALIGRYDPARDLSWLEAGLEVVDVSEEPAGDWVDEVIALKRRVFSESPQFCWFYSNPGFADADAEQLRESGPAIHYVVRGSSGGLLGYFGSSLNAGSLWGVEAGMDLVLAPSLQGHGVIKTGYRLLLERQLDHGVSVFKGGTSQPSVMGLGRLMGRRILGWSLRRRAHFSPEHFFTILLDR